MKKFLVIKIYLKQREIKNSKIKKEKCLHFEFLSKKY